MKLGHLLPLAAAAAAAALCACGGPNTAVRSAVPRKGAADISESDEYYLGRGVAAQILGKYKPLDNPRLNLYVRVLGQAVALASDRPYTFIGYRFQVLDSDELNAFAAPGGFIFVTKALVDKTTSEDELAGVLAHEIAHVSLKHGLKTIRAARLASASSITAFEGSIDDVVGALVVDGYSRDKEYEADKLGAVYAGRAGYDPRGLARVIARLKGAPGAGLMKTHPHPEFRLEKLQGVKTPADYKPSAKRDARFKKSVAATS
jgi:predicted Zn-dependent protease